MRRGLLLSAVLAIALSSVALAPVADAAFPGQNGRIAYVTTAGDHRAIYTVDAQGADPQPLIDLGSGRDAINPAWSWDGQSVAFAGQTSPGGPFAIYVADADGSAPPRQVTTPPVSDIDPTWEPYGTQIAFTRRLDGDASVIAIVTLSTEAVTTLPVPGVSMEPSWSPDGRSIAFANKAPTASCRQTPCRFEIFEATPDGLTTRLIAWEPWWDFDLHHPDWSPDGSLIVARFGHDEGPFYAPSGVLLYDSATGEGLDQVGPCHIMSEPSFSPDGQWIVFTSTPVNMDTGEPGEPNLFCVLRTDGTDGYFLEGSPPRSDAAWGIVPGSAPPPPDRTPPTIEFRPDPSASDWLDASFAGSVNIVAIDDRSPPSVACTDNGEPLSLSTESSGSTTDAVATLAEGYNHIECIATDGAGYSIAGSATYQVDLTPPTTSAPQLSPLPTVVRVGETVSLSASANDPGSGIRSLDVRVEGLGAIPPTEWENSGYSASLTASFVPTRPDLSKVIVSARDNAGWVAESGTPFVSYDPSAGSTDGTGWIVPGGPTSGPGDVLPGLDGARKASFGFTAKYKTPSSVAPAGTLTFSYGNRFKLQSRQLLWLAVRDGGTAYLGGFASIQGMDGEFSFVAVIIGGTSTASADRFELRVYEPGTEIASPAPLFAASGDAGGQIQIRS
jgi:Tol biopolymer transport system component